MNKRKSKPKNLNQNKRKKEKKKKTEKKEIVRDRSKLAGKQLLCVFL